MSAQVQSSAVVHLLNSETFYHNELNFFHFKPISLYSWLYTILTINNNDHDLCNLGHSILDHPGTVIRFSDHSSILMLVSTCSTITLLTQWKAMQYIGTGKIFVKCACTALFRVVRHTDSVIKLPMQCLQAALVATWLRVADAGSKICGWSFSSFYSFKTHSLCSNVSLNISNQGLGQVWLFYLYAMQNIFSLLLRRKAERYICNWVQTCRVVDRCQKHNRVNKITASSTESFILDECLSRANGFISFSSLSLPELFNQNKARTFFVQFIFLFCYAIRC